MPGRILLTNRNEKDDKLRNANVCWRASNAAANLIRWKYSVLPSKKPTKRFQVLQSIFQWKEDSGMFNFTCDMKGMHKNNAIVNESMQASHAEVLRNGGCWKWKMLHWIPSESTNQPPSKLKYYLSKNDWTMQLFINKRTVINSATTQSKVFD